MRNGNGVYCFCLLLFLKTSNLVRFVHWHSQVFQDISLYKTTLNENFLAKTFILNKLYEPYYIYLCNKQNFARFY